jgi:flagella basal body P-ring formation protein FlgA
MEVAMNNGRPLGKKKTLQLLLLLTFLAWATQTLIHQWGFGDEIDNATPDSANTPAQVSDSSPTPAPDPEPVAQEQFVTGGSSEAVVAATLELRSEATIVGSEVKLKQICRWDANDQTILAPIADLTVYHISGSAPFHTLLVDDVRQTLHDAGVNLATINFVGAASCTVTRSDSQTDPQSALRDWINSRQNLGASTQPQADSQSTGSTIPFASAAAPAAAIVPSSTPIAPRSDAPDPKPFHTLAEQLTADACQELGVSPDAIQMTFRPQDEVVLNLTDVCFKFDIQATRLRNLGLVSWDVTMYSGVDSKKVDIEARAMEWQDQVIVAKPLVERQILHESDFLTRHVLVDSLPDQPLLTLAQCVGEQAALDLKPGQLMTSRFVDAVPMVRAGQLVTVTLTEGSVQIREVARAMEMGVMGETIKVRNDTTRDILDVVVTGEQEARLGSSSDSAGSAIQDN